MPNDFPVEFVYLHLNLVFILDSKYCREQHVHVISIHLYSTSRSNESGLRVLPTCDYTGHVYNTPLWKIALRKNEIGLLTIFVFFKKWQKSAKDHILSNMTIILV